MTTIIKTELKNALRQLHLPAFAANHAAQAALAANESWTYDQYLLRLSELELGEREARKRLKLLQASRLPREKTLENFERTRLNRNVERQFAALLDGEFLKRPVTILTFDNPDLSNPHFPPALVP